jgi:hypothetical protein
MCFRCDWENFEAVCNDMLKVQCLEIRVALSMTKIACGATNSSVPSARDRIGVAIYVFVFLHFNQPFQGIREYALVINFEVDNKYCKCYNSFVSAELDQYQYSEFGLEGLVKIVQGILERAATAPVDARVAEIPDARTLRYYQTKGIMDKPTRYDGRRAVYGYRHLLQALSVKLWQGQGYSLAQIQQALWGADNVKLERVVVELLGERQSVLGVPPPIPEITRLRGAPQGKALIAVEVGQGVSVILDPAQVEDPEVVLVAVRELLNAIREEA